MPSREDGSPVPFQGANPQADYRSYIANNVPGTAGPMLGGVRPPGGTSEAMDVGGNRGYFEDGSPIPPPIMALINMLMNQQMRR